MQFIQRLIYAADHFTKIITKWRQHLKTIKFVDKVPRVCSGMIICTAIIEWNRFKQPKEPSKAFWINALIIIITKVHPKVHAHVLIIIYIQSSTYNLTRQVEISSCVHSSFVDNGLRMYSIHFRKANSEIAAVELNNERKSKHWADNQYRLQRMNNHITKAHKFYCLPKLWPMVSGKAWRSSRSHSSMSFWTQKVYSSLTSRFSDR